MASIALSFNNVDLTPVNNNDGQIWVTSSELAKALGYKSSKSITNLYNANACEFTDTMSTVIDVVTVRKTGSIVMPTRIFSLRGCHLIGMFARTKIAQDFRVWVLNILDAHVASDLNKGYQLGSLQSMRDENRARYAVGFTVASGGGKTLSNWKHEKHALDSELQVIDNLMQPLLTGFNEAKAVEVVK